LEEEIMTTNPTAREDRAETRNAEKKGKPPLVVVELARRRSSEQIRRLRKGRGKLVEDIEDAVEELVHSGTIKADAQPVVIVVREAWPTPLLWPGYDEDDDDEDDEDNNDDED
jgi:Family of unknown function (DUF6200)